MYCDIWNALSSEKEMIFLSGPRQTGKTTFALDVAKSFNNNFYFNWDIISNKHKLIENPTFFETMNRKDESRPLVILDEIHKYGDWKNYLKGIYDEFAADYQFLVSGSGRLDIYQKGGDSLAGRYFHMRMFPFTVAELSKKRRKFSEFMQDPLSGFDINNKSITADLWQTLFNTSGFPEPYTKGKNSFWTRWSANYIKQIIREDIRDTLGLKKLDAMETLFSLLPSRVASPVSLSSLSRDLRVSFETVDRWFSLFDSFYLTFRISPWTKKISRSILKEKKVYLYNYPEINDEAARFENMAAVELLRAIHNWNDLGYGRFSLCYLRNKDKEEVDFIIVNNNKPVLLIETKSSDKKISPNLKKFQNILRIPAVQLVNKDNIFKYHNNDGGKILVITASRWLSSLP